MTRQQIIGYIVGLVTSNDHDLVYQDAILPGEVCAPEDRELVRSASEAIRSLWDSSWPDGYLESPEFQGQLNGKSQQYAAMMRKLWSSPPKRKIKRDELAAALRDLLDSDRVLALIPERLVPLVLQVREGITQIGNPNKPDATDG